MRILPHRAHEDQRIDELVGVGRGDEDDGSMARDAPGGAGVDFAEEEVGDDGEDPEEEVVDDGVPGLFGFGFGRHGQGGVRWIATRGAR